MQGQGKMTYYDGDLYEGSFLDGNREGHGKYLYSHGDSYEGNWKKNE